MKNTYFKLSAVLLLAALLLGGARLGAQSLILTSDEQLNDLMDPDKKLDLSLGYTPYHASLRDICEQGKKQGSKQMVFAFDEFFRQYRQHAGTERRLTPDMDEYVEKIKFVSDFAKKYDIGLCLSLLSPLELGTAYKNQTGHSGRWLAYKVGLRDGSTGKFSVPIWEQLYWTNNKGKTPVKLKGVKAYAFKEKPVGNSPFRAVNPDEIVELKEVKYEAMDTYDSDNFVPGVGNTGNLMRLLRVYGEGGGLEGYDRVMVLLEYETQEMDYFNEDALPFLKALMKKYHDNDINLTALYSDEMHIQQDWFYFSHHENGQFAERYLTESMADKYRKKFGQPFDDKYMLYFAYGAPNYQPTVEAVVNVQYVMGDTPEDIHRTFLLRDRYYRMLNDEVVDLFKAAKDYEPIGTYSHPEAGTYSGDAATKWVFDESRQEGDTEIVENGTSIYLLVFHSRTRNDYNTVDVRHILFKVDTTGLDSKAEDYQAKLEELKAGKKQEAENALQAWKDGDATEESFAALANKLSEDPGSNTNGGLYKQVYKGRMVSEFNDWCFDDSRKAGDTGIVANDAAGGSYIGYHVMYFVGTDDPYWMVQVRNAMTNKDYSQWSANLVKDITATENSGMKYVG